MYERELQEIYQIDDIYSLSVIIILIAIATQALVFLLRESDIFAFLRYKYSPFRIVFNCGYCTSFHIACILSCPLLLLYPVGYANILAYFIVLLVIQRLSNVFHDLTKLLYFGRVKHISLIHKKDDEHKDPVT